MKKIVSIILVLCLCLTLCGCVCLNVPTPDNVESTYSDVSIPVESIAPSVPEPTPSSEPEPEVETLTSDEALKIAKERIASYIQCSFFCVCCDVEYSSEDLSQYLTESQKNRYFGYQYKITCCKSKGEIRSHIAECLDESMVNYTHIDSYHTENLFCDNNNNWYLIVPPMGMGYYDNITVTEHSNDKIIAQGYYGSEGTVEEQPTVFTIEKRNGNFVLTDIK